MHMYVFSYEIYTSMPFTIKNWGPAIRFVIGCGSFAVCSTRPSCNVVLNNNAECGWPSGAPRGVEFKELKTPLFETKPLFLK